MLVRVKSITMRVINGEIYLSDSVDDVIDLENAPDGLTGQGDGAGADQERLDHVLLEDVGNGALPHIDPGGLLALGVFVAEFSHCA